MQFVYILLIITLLALLVVAAKHLHWHASSKTVEEKVQNFLNEHLQTHHAKKQIGPAKSKPKSSKK